MLLVCLCKVAITTMQLPFNTSTHNAITSWNKLEIFAKYYYVGLFMYGCDNNDATTVQTRPLTTP